MLNPDYRDMLSAFTEESVEYLLVGAYALAVHGHVRATGDIDLCFETPGVVFQIGVAPRPINILTTIDAVDFEAAWSEREEVEVAGSRVPVISRRHLLQNKRATSWPKDRADEIWLEGEDG